MAFKLGMTVDVCTAYRNVLVSMILQWVDRKKNQRLIILTTKQ